CSQHYQIRKFRKQPRDRFVREFVIGFINNYQPPERSSEPGQVFLGDLTSRRIIWRAEYYHVSAIFRRSLADSINVKLEVGSQRDAQDFAAQYCDNLAIE